MTAPALESDRAPWCRRLVIMVKAAAAGRVKTRLARDIGVIRATAFYRHTSAAVIARLANDARWQTVLAVTPDSALAEPIWPAAMMRIAQGPGDLGARMRRVFAVLPPGPAVIVGTDIPAIRNRDIAAAFKTLGDNDVVFGPAPDGGYWLVGAARRKPCPAAFANVRWSGPDALNDSIASFAPLKIATTTTLADVDNGAEYRNAGSDFGRRVAPA